MLKLLPCLILLFSSHLVAQEYVLEWERTYGTGYANWANKIIATADGNFVMVGVKRNPQGKHNSWMTKIDATGGVIWESSRAAARFDWANGIVETQLEDLIVIGTTNNTRDNNIIFLKMNSEGKIIQEKQIGKTTTKEGATHVLINEKDELIILAYKELDIGKRSLYILKTDTEGNLIWEREVNNRFWNLGTAMIKNNKGEYLIGGHQYGNARGKSDLLLLTIDESGDITWRKVLERFGWNEIRSLHVEANGNILVTGLTTDPVSRQISVLLTNLDARGEVKHQNILSYGKNSWGTSILRNAAGFGVLVSTALSTHKSGEIFFTLLDPVLKEISNQRFGTMQWDESYNIVKTTENDLLLLSTGIDTQSKFQHAKVMKFKWLDKSETDLEEVDLENLEEDDFEIGKVFTLDKIRFKQGSYELTPEAKTEVTKLSAVMLKYKKLKIELSGHTSLEGSHSKNMTLSRRRVEVVKNYLIHLTVAEQRIKTQAFGETQPLCTAEDETCQAKNRRVELRILEY